MEKLSHGAGQLKKPEDKEKTKETKKIRGQEQTEQREKRKEETETGKEDKVGFEKLLTQNLKALKINHFGSF